MRKETVPSGRRTLADAGVAIHVRLGRTRKRPDTSEILLVRILLDEFLDRRHWLRGKRFRGGPRSGWIIEPHHRVGGATGQCDRAARFHRHRHDARAGLLRAQFVGERRCEQVSGAVAEANRTAVGDVRRRRVCGAPGECPLLPLPPGVVNHPVAMRQRAGADRRVTGARDRDEIGVACVLEHHALIEQCAEPVAPMLVEYLEVIGAQLIDDDRDDKARRISGAQGRSVESERRGKQTRSGYEGDESTHDGRILQDGAAQSCNNGSIPYSAGSSGAWIALSCSSAISHRLTSIGFASGISSAVIRMRTHGR